jgi:hypothetical protein
MRSGWELFVSEECVIRYCLCFSIIEEHIMGRPCMSVCRAFSIVVAVTLDGIFAVNTTCVFF